MLVEDIELNLITFLTSAINGFKWSASRQYSFGRKLGCSKGVLTWIRREKYITASYSAKINRDNTCTYPAEG